LPTIIRSCAPPFAARCSRSDRARASTTLALIAERSDLDLLLVDLNMPGVRGLDVARAVRSASPLLPVAVVSAEEQPGLASALLALGVSAFIPKSDPAEVIVGAVRLVLAGGVYVPPRLIRDFGAPAKAGSGTDPGLTARQLDVLRLLAQGKSNKVIARELGVTEGTVKVHLLAVFRTLDVRNRTAAVIAAQRFLD
jgi:DNA-binding NarL/FixJ family response regulator